MRSRTASGARHDADPQRRQLMVVTAAIGVGATLVVLMFPAVQFAYRSPAFHISLETAAGLIAALAAFLFFGRLKHNRRQGNWALVYALALSAAINIGLSAVPAIIDTPAAGEFSTWAAVSGRLVAAASFVFAAFAPVRWVTRGEHVGYSILAGVAVTVGVICLVTSTLFRAAPQPVVELLDPTVPSLEILPALSLLQLTTMLLFSVAAFGFIRRSEGTGDELMRWLAAGAVLAAFSRMHYALFPSLYTGWVYTGDFLRIGFYTLILIGATGEIRRYWSGLAAAAAADERRRIARDLHDGLAQELAYIAVQTRWLANHDADGETLRSVGAAADRALDESRRAIAALTRADDEPLDVALAQAAEEVADRVNANVRLDLQGVPPIPAEAQEGLIRIAREAIANAGRHSGTDEVVVRLFRDDAIRLHVSDAGVGFDTGTAPPGRFGLISMRERAEALDAEFVLTSSPGRGTTVEVALP